jgi:beta-glucosidase-like glycosyl hydrolase/CubicO group peptidase (beta-lactamase class C family)
LLFLILYNPVLRGQEVIDSVWVQKTFESLSLDQKLGQLFVVRASSNEDPYEKNKIFKLIKEENIGGLCFFKGSPENQARLTNEYQSKSKLPLLISIDGEWGLGMRHKNQSITYPRQLMLGAIQDNNLIYQMGKDIAEQCKRIGINLNFAPVVDVNNNIENPVINDRSFGEDKINVSAKSYAYMQGLQEGGIMACAKHFPGHGDTNVDSHYDLPVINHDLERLQNIELFPFNSMIKLGIESIMVAHLHIPVLDDRPNRATTLSRNTVTSLLREKMQFDGLIITDALEMKGVTKHFNPGQVDAEALLAGNDILLLPADIPKAKKYIRKYIKEGKISLEQIDQSVLRILKAKSKYHVKSIDNIQNIDKDINNPKYQSLLAELVENAVTLVANENNLVPILDVNQKILSIALGSPNKNTFQTRLESYGEIEHLNYSHDITMDEVSKAVYRAKTKDLVIVSIHDFGKSVKNNFGLKSNELQLIEALNQKYDVILVLFGNPYSLKNFDKVKNVLISYEDNELTRDITAQSLFGVNPILGKLPISASEKYHLNKGITTFSLGRLGFSIPERVGMSRDTLSKISLVVDTIISTKAAPGCQILIARKGKIIYQKSFGHFRYDKVKAVGNNDVYDVASITKVFASTLGIMRLTDAGQIDINLPVSKYIAETDTSNKRNITLAEMMAHHGKLKPWIPFYRSTLKEGRWSNTFLPGYYSTTLKDSFDIPVAERLFLRSDYRDTIWSKIYGSELRDNDNYRYSDLGFYMAGLCIENKCYLSMDAFLNAEFYSPLGLRYTTFNPLQKIEKNKIAPTEKDYYFRNQELQGVVHDMGAAMMGGVSGHAGLFSNAYELGIISQMLLNRGFYGGKTYIQPETIEKFTRRFYKSTRRAIGFDMKELDLNKNPNMSPLASDKTYGHYGFTGTAAFIDPEYDLIYIFLSNRTYPDMKNNKLNKYNYRSKIQSIAYRAII